jgi:hypothetical protein
MKYEPYMFMDGLIDALQAGGFEFQSAAPRREVNSCLLKLKGVTKTNLGAYQIVEAAEILPRALEFWDAAMPPSASAAPEKEDEVPF